MLAKQLLCSSLGGDTDVEVRFDPADSGERFLVVTCRGGGCSVHAPGSGPEVNPPAGARALARSRDSLSFAAPPGADSVERLTEGSGAIHGLILTARLDRGPSYPLMAVTISLPERQSALAAAILRSFVSPQLGA